MAIRSLAQRFGLLVFLSLLICTTDARVSPLPVGNDQQTDLKLPVGDQKQNQSNKNQSTLNPKMVLSNGKDPHHPLLKPDSTVSPLPVGNDQQTVLKLPVGDQQQNQSNKNQSTLNPKKVLSNGKDPHHPLLKPDATVSPLPVGNDQQTDLKLPVGDQKQNQSATTQIYQIQTANMSKCGVIREKIIKQWNVERKILKTDITSAFNSRTTNFTCEIRQMYHTETKENIFPVDIIKVNAESNITKKTEKTLEKETGMLNETRKIGGTQGAYNNQTETESNKGKIKELSVNETKHDGKDDYEKIKGTDRVTESTWTEKTLKPNSKQGRDPYLNLTDSMKEGESLPFVEDPFDVVHRMNRDDDDDEDDEDEVIEGTDRVPESTWTEKTLTPYSEEGRVSLASKVTVMPTTHSSDLTHVVTEVKPLPSVGQGDISPGIGTDDIKRDKENRTITKSTAGCNFNSFEVYNDPLLNCWPHEKSLLGDVEAEVHVNFWKSKNFVTVLYGNQKLESGMTFGFAPGGLSIHFDLA